MITLRNYQEYAVNSVFEYFAGNSGNPLIACPTGTGKSLILAGIIKRILQTWPEQRILLLTHVKELIEQDQKALQKLWPQCPSAIYSSGLKQKNVGPVTFGGVASVVKAIDKFLNTNIILIDEAHLVSPSAVTMYRKIINSILEHNPNLKVIGTTATIWRLGQGRLTEGPTALFDDVCCDLTTIDNFNWFIDQGFLAPLVPKPMNTQFDLSDVHIVAGEYNKRELNAAVDKNSITAQAIDEIMYHGQDRNSWLVFASSIEHAEHVAQELELRDVSVGIVHSKMKDCQRDKVLANFKKGRLRAVVNQNVLTTGFDHPGTDLIAVLRPTKSSSLWVQMLGRGTRPADGKRNCIVLDFARNTEELGPINDPVIPDSKRRTKGGSAPVRLCPECLTYLHASVRVCSECGHEFPRGVNIYANAGTKELIKKKEEEPIIKTLNVDHITYQFHTKNSFTSLKVSYFCGLTKVDQYLHYERKGNALQAAWDWHELFGNQPFPKETQELDLSVFLEPATIDVIMNKKYPEIVSYG